MTMPVHMHPESGLAIVLMRDGRELDHRVARDGVRAVSMAMHMLSVLDELQPGDKLTVTNYIGGTPK
jgi:hypothetical protein